MKTTIFPEQPNFKIEEGKKLRIKFGIDPTSDKLHLGHLIPLLIVKKLKDEGHHIDIVLGTFTAQLGDPSGRNSMRPILDQETTKKNADSILEQVKRVLGHGFNVHFNHTWFEDLNSIDMIQLLSKFSVQNMLSRDSFQNRFEEQNPIGLHELIVPILQGIDSVKLKTDIEIGGTDQLFNFSITREIQRHFGQKPETCFLSSIINGIDGRKMSKSFNNCIFINDRPFDVFGKVMSISDELMTEWFPIFMDIPLDITKPFEEKKKLAFVITSTIWSEGFAEIALNEFEQVIQKKEIPDVLPLTDLKEILKVVSHIRNCSKSEARRLISHNSVKVNGNIINDDHLLLNSNDIIKVGKRSFAKIK